MPEQEQPKIRFYGGIKWGLGLPTVILVGQHTLESDHLHIVREFYHEEALLDDILDTAKEWSDELKIRKFFCDPKEPEFIKQLRQKRTRAHEVPDEVTMAIQLIRKRLDNQSRGLPGGITVSRDCPFTIGEFSKFRRPDRDPRKPYRDRPLDVDNYAVGALHFLVLGLAFEPKPRVRWL